MMIYSIPDGNAVKRIAFNRRLIDYNIQTHNGKYKGKTKGILKEYEKPIRSCIIFSKKYLSQVKELCKELEIPTKFYEIKKLD